MHLYCLFSCFRIWMKDLPFKDWINFQEHYEENIDNWNWQTVKHSSPKPNNVSLVSASADLPEIAAESRNESTHCRALRREVEGQMAEATQEQQAAW